AQGQTPAGKPAAIEVAEPPHAHTPCRTWPLREAQCRRPRTQGPAGSRTPASISRQSGSPAATGHSQSWQAAQHLFSVLQPVGHAHLAVHRHRRGDVLARLLALACAPVELPEAEGAVGDKRAHPTRLGECERVTVEAVSVLRGIAAGRDLAEEAEGPRLVAALTALAAKGQGSPGEVESVLDPVGEDGTFAQT